MKKLVCVFSVAVFVVLFCISVVWSIGLKLGEHGMLWPNCKWMLDSLEMVSVITGFHPAKIHVVAWLMAIAVGVGLLNSCTKSGASRSG